MVNGYGIQASDGSWIQWVTIDARRDSGAPAVGWTPRALDAYASSLREAKALSTLLSVEDGKHPLRVRRPE